jgi:hypothetical protein
MDIRHADCRQAGGDFADDLDAGLRQPECAHHRNGHDDDEQRRRPTRKKASERHEQRDCREADNEREDVGLVERHYDMEKALEHIAGDALNTEQLG